jgi:putative phosphoesterase
MVVGVVADTHIPDRVNGLHPDLLVLLRQAGVEQILHAGDISTARVLTELAQVAPVTAVSGNRDFTIQPVLPLVRRLELGGVRVILTHGHGGWWGYWLNKLRYFAFGYQLRYYRDWFKRSAGDAQVCIFGHTHHAEIGWYDGRLLFNPGSTSRNKAPSFGLLRIDSDGQVEGEIVKLTGYRIQGGAWKKLLT